MDYTRVSRGFEKGKTKRVRAQIAARWSESQITGIMQFSNACTRRKLI